MRVSRFGIFVIFFCVSVISIFVLSGHSHTVEIQQKLLCHAMGVDYENGEYSVTIQAFKPSGAGSDTPVDITKSNIEVVGGKGKTIAQALEHCETTKGKTVFLGHLQLICFGRSVDFSDPKRLFEFCLKDKTVYLGVSICLSDTTAKELMELQLTNSALSTENYTAVIDKNEEKARSVKCTLLDFFKNSNNTSSVAVPVLRANAKGEEPEKKQSDKPALELVSTAVISGGKVLPTELSPDNCAGFCLLHGKCKQAVLALTLQGGKSSVQLTVKSRGRRINTENGRLVFNAELTVVVQKVKDIVTEYQPQEVSQKVKEVLQRQFDEIYEKIEQGEKADILGICRQIRHEYPKTYLEYEDDPQKIIELTRAKLDVQCLVQ